jgi:succinate dehydrogenase / fumarate reductase cytochrome b subunit
MNALESSIGRKVAMASTGILLLAFLVVHAIGNATIYTGGLNAYAASLRAFAPGVWFLRLVLLALFLAHAWYGILLTLENRAAKPQGYAVTAHRTSTVSSRTMIWTGLAIAAFVLFHELHFTVQAIHPEAGARAHPDAAGRPDVLRMVALGFRHPGTALAYTLAMLALGSHLFHGVQSAAQTFGLNGPRTFAGLQLGGRLLALLLALAFLAIPAAVLARLVG